MIIGVISDTHGFLDPRIGSIFKDVEHILHGGDVGSGSILVELEQIAPVTAVLGNVDVGLDLKETESLQLNGRKFLLHHIVNPQALSDQVQGWMQAQSPDVVVYGHSHRPHCETIGQTLFLNPGYAGKPRFNLPRSVAVLHSEGKELRTHFTTLAP